MNKHASWVQSNTLWARYFCRWSSADLAQVAGVDLATMDRLLAEQYDWIEVSGYRFYRCALSADLRSTLARRPRAGHITRYRAIREQV